MTKEQVMKAMYEQKAVMVEGYDGLFLVVEVNLMLKTVGLVRLTGGNGIPDMSVGFENIEVAENYDQQKNVKEGLATMENKELIKKLKKEQDELNKKLWKLFFFINDQEDSQTISNYHLDLLKAQREDMLKYSDILGMRISDLEEHHD